MRIGRTIGALSVMALTACDALSLCGTERSYAMGGAFAVTAVAASPVDSIPKEIDVGTDRISDANLEARPGAFDDLWGALFEETALPAGTGIALTLEGAIPNTGGSITRAVLILPTPLRKGVEYPIDRAFPVPIGLHNPDVFQPRYLGREPLASPGHAEIALFYGRREFVQGDPLAQEIPRFVATAATGTVRVIEDDGDDLRLRFDVTLTDASARKIHLRGDIVALREVQDVPCVS